MTDVIETVGSGGTHATIAAWISAHNAKDMVGTTTRYIGELIDQVYEVDAGTLTVANATGTRSASWYRWLRAAASAGSYYRPERHTGPRIYVRWTGSGDQAGIQVAATENFFRMSQFAVICEDPQEVSGGNKYGIQVLGDNFLASRMFVRISEGGQRKSASAPIFYCYYINGTGASPNDASNATFLNCIAYGSRYYKGAHEGFFFDSFASNGGCYNCASHQIRHHTTGTVAGFLALTGSTVKPKLVNCIATDCSPDFSGLWASIAVDPTNGADPLSVAEQYQCIASDFSLAFDAQNPRVSLNRNGIDARTLHLRPEIQDIRPPAASVAFKNGRDMTSVWTGFGLTADDFDGVARPAALGGNLAIGWTIGPYHNVGTPLTTTLPTTQIKSIGSAAGRDYANVQAWLDATSDQSLIYQNKILIGELYADSDFAITSGSRVIVRRTIADAQRYRQIRPAAGQAFDPISGYGVKITGPGSGTTGENNLFEIHESRFKLNGPLLIDQNSGAAAARRGLKVEGDFVKIDAVFGKLLAGTGTASHVFFVRGSRVLMTNCIAKGSNSTGTGANSGFNIQNCEFTRAYNCVADRVKGNAGGNGFREGANTDRVEFSNCIATDCTTGISHATSTNSKTTQSFCITSDATADGVGAQVSVASATLFKAAASDDYRNVVGSSAIKRGRNLTSRFSGDFLGIQRFAPFDVGAYEGLPQGALFPAPQFRESHAFMVLWEIARTDGVVLFFSDQNEPVPYRGRTYKVGGSFTATNRRDESELLNKTVSIRAAITGADITAADLAAGRYRGARVREILLGAYAFTVPIEESFYVLDQNEYDRDAMDADLASLSALLDKNAGRIKTVNCPLRFGGEECTVDLTPNTLDDVRVNSIVDVRRKFLGNSTDIPGSYADDYFGKGKLIWLTGANIGIVSQVKLYTASTRTIEVEESLPFDVTTADTFQVEPGCRKRYKVDCITKNSNGTNNGGDPFFPGTGKALSTPTR